MNNVTYEILNNTNDKWLNYFFNGILLYVVCCFLKLSKEDLMSLSKRGDPTKMVLNYITKLLEPVNMIDMLDQCVLL